MNKLNHILVPTDFGPASSEAVDVALELASKFDAAVTLLHTWEIAAYPYMGYVTSSVNLADTMEKAAAGALAATLKDLQARLPRAKAVLKMGLPWQEIVGAVKELRVDLVVMGTHGRHGLSHLLMGSVAEKVVRLCPVPVLTMRGPSTA